MATFERLTEHQLRRAGTDKRFAVRDSQGRFMYVDEIGRSLAHDIKTQAKTSRASRETRSKKRKDHATDESIESLTLKAWRTTYDNHRKKCKKRDHSKCRP